MNYPSFPKYFSIQTTSVCNASCVFCPYESIKKSFPKKIMEMKLFKKIINECSRNKDVGVIILYMNNEPLTDPHLIERINYAKEKIPWASVHILTNGLLLTDKMADKLLDSKLDWIGISFQGIRKETIEKAMGIPYGVALERINNFTDKVRQKKNIKDYLMITFLGHKFLAKGEKEEAVDYWKSKGIERIGYFEKPISRAGNVKDLANTYHKEKIIDCKSIWADEMIHIVEDGKVVLCCMDWKREVILGDLSRESIKKIWDGKRRKIWQMIYGEKDMPGEFLCRRCEEAELTKPSQKVALIKNSGSNVDKLKYEDEDLLLVVSPPWQTKMVPLGLAYLSQYLKSKGVKVKSIDLNVNLFKEASGQNKYFWGIDSIKRFSPSDFTERFIKNFGDELGDFVNRVCDSKVKIVGFSTTIASAGVAVYLAHQIKRRDPSKITILGGPGCYWNTDQIDPERIVDVFVVGEGEKPLLEIVKRLKDNNSLSSLSGIQGTLVCRDKEYLSFLPPDPIMNLNEIPTPDFCDFNLEDYGEGIYKPLPILISRGCINRCTFCIDHKMNFPFRIRDPKKVFEEIKFYLERYGVRNFEFNDLLCNGNIKQLGEICDLIIKNNLNINWTSYAAIREGMSLELCKKMKESGCRWLCYGMESASDVVLKRMKKRYNAKLAEEVIRNTHNAGIEATINIILGHPGESNREFKKTCRFLKNNREYISSVVNVSTCFIMVNTDLMENLDKFGVYFKRTLKDRIGCIFKRKEFYPNYRNYYVAPGNTAQRRVFWFRKMLKLLHKINIPYIILNNVVEHDRDLDRFVAELKKRYCRKHTIDFKGTGIDLSQQGSCKLFRSGLELTKDVGMNTSFFVNDRWIDSSSAEWSKRVKGNSAEIDICWPGVAIKQKWAIRLENKYIDWSVKTVFCEKLKIYQNKIGIMVSNNYDKYKHNNSIYNFHSSKTDNWEEVMFSKISSINLLADNAMGPLNLTFEPKDDIFLQVQNAPFLASRMVNFCFLNVNHPDGFNEDGKTFDKDDYVESRIRIYIKKHRV
ncbi:radical SAM protein [Candidatus Omnitrophota bacterium]